MAGHINNRAWIALNSKTPDIFNSAMYGNKHDSGAQSDMMFGIKPMTTYSGILDIVKNDFTRVKQVFLYNFWIT